MKVTRNAIKKIRKAAKAQLKKDRRAAKRAVNAHYTMVDLDSEKTTVRVPLDLIEKKLIAGHTEAMRYGHFKGPGYSEGPLKGIGLKLPPAKHEGPEGFHQ